VLITSSERTIGDVLVHVSQTVVHAAPVVHGGPLAASGEKALPIYVCAKTAFVG
jgi:hypothetical protein